MKLDFGNILKVFLIFFSPHHLMDRGKTINQFLRRLINLENLVCLNQTYLSRKVPDSARR